MLLDRTRSHKQADGAFLASGCGRRGLRQHANRGSRLVIRAGFSWPQEPLLRLHALWNAGKKTVPGSRYLPRSSPPSLPPSLCGASPASCRQAQPFGPAIRLFVPVEVRLQAVSNRPGCTLPPQAALEFCRAPPQATFPAQSGTIGTIQSCLAAVVWALHPLHLARRATWRRRHADSCRLRRPRFHSSLLQPTSHTDPPTLIQNRHGLCSAAARQ